MLTRRSALRLLLGATAAARTLAATPGNAGRALDLLIGDGFGDASAADIGAVLRSAGESLWSHCPNTRWEVPGFFVYRSTGSPITNYEHRADGRIAIGLDVDGRYWAQFAFQFAHEFCHALAGHSNDWHRLHIRGRSRNHWLEESLCETASLFALRAMSETWKTKAPYPNYRSFAPKLADYAQDRLDQATRDLAEAVKSVPNVRSSPAIPSVPFFAWFRSEEVSLRQNSTQRPKNLVIASQLLPIFEAEPGGWEAVTYCNVPARVPERTLQTYFDDWSACAPLGQRAFVSKLAACFGVTPTPAAS